MEILERKKLNPVLSKIQVRLSSHEMGEMYREVLVRITRTSDIPGFRKGKAPSNVVENHTGKSVVWKRTCDYAAGTIFNQIAQNENISLIFDPVFEYDDYHGDGVFEFSAVYHTEPDQAAAHPRPPSLHELTGINPNAGLPSPGIDPVGVLDDLDANIYDRDDLIAEAGQINPGSMVEKIQKSKIPDPFAVDDGVVNIEKDQKAEREGDIE